MAKPTNKRIPDNVIQLLAAADERQGFPPGTMASVMQQEVGGNSAKYLSDPTAYHYAAGRDGRRVAKHTGKVSTAFGPFGILESTGKDPGYGVKPLQSKDLEEQVRFASDYLAARSKRSGGLKGGLAGYGEGTGYSEQVANRIPDNWGREARGPLPVAVPSAVVAAAEATTPPPSAPPVQEVAPIAAAPQMSTGPNTWEQFLSTSMANKPVAAVEPEQLAYGPGWSPSMEVRRPDFMGMSSMGQAPRAVDFSAFGSWGRKV